MKGIVFTEFLDLVEDKFGLEMVDNIIENSDLESNGVYTSIGTYKFSEMLQLLQHLSANTNISIDDLLLVYGEYEIIQEEHPTIYAYSRTLDDEQMKILLNFSESISKINLLDLGLYKEVLINNYNELLIDKNTITLQPYQAVVLKF